MRDHVETCLMELKGLEAEVNRVENNLDPLLEKANQAYEKLNKSSNEHLKDLNIGDRASLMVAINYPMWGEQVYHEIKDSVLRQLPEVEALKMELLELTSLGVLELWKVDGAIVLEAEFLEKIKILIEKTNDVDSFLASFDEAHLLTFFDSWVNRGGSGVVVVREMSATIGEGAEAMVGDVD